jgi:hypothetical protein
VSIWKWQKTDCARVVVVEEVSRGTGGTFFALGAVISIDALPVCGLKPPAGRPTSDKERIERSSKRQGLSCDVAR